MNIKKLNEELQKLLDSNNLENLMKDYYTLVADYQRLKSKKEVLTSKNSKAGFKVKKNQMKADTKNIILDSNKEKIDKLQAQMNEKEKAVKELKKQVYEVAKEIDYPGNLFNQDITTLSNKLFNYFKKLDYVLYDIKVTEQITALGYRLPQLVNGVLKAPDQKLLKEIFPNAVDIRSFSTRENDMNVGKIVFKLEKQ